MSFYRNRLMESAVEPEDVIQTPDEVGNDLDAIEKAVAGPDGIEAHRDEVEAAVEGIIGEPLEEAYYIMYESTYNYNQLLQAIGIHELNEACNGNDLVLEAADKAGFFTRVKDILKGMFKRITEAFMTVYDKLMGALRVDKEFVGKNRERIMAGYNTDWSAKGYLYPDKITMNEAYEGTKLKEEFLKNMAAAAKDGSAKVEAVDHAKIIKDISGKDAADIKAMREAIEKDLKGEKVELNKGNVKIDVITKFLLGEDEVKALKDSYKKIKDSYAKAIKFVADIEKEVSKETYANIGQAFSICEHYTSALTFEQNVQNSIFAISLAAARGKRAQARQLVHLFYRAAGAEEKKVEVQHNSASLDSIFGKLQMI